MGRTAPSSAIRFHLFYENWDPIDAEKHSWDSPLAGHAVSNDGIRDFKILSPAVDERTKPTGQFKEFTHPYWSEEDPENYPSNVARYEVHEPAQHAYGDWAAITVGGQYYLFGDFHPAGANKKEMSTAWFTSPDINETFTFCGSVGHGHPDPDIAFAEGQFYLVTQTEDFVSPGPWVETVEARIGVDTTNDGQIDTWSDWTEIRETYHHIEGLAKQVAVTPAALDLTSLPGGFGAAFQLRIKDTTETEARPVLRQVALTYE